ncbi:hypothetical protein MTR67_039512 [Solanum verrucosum]|uniref:Retrotransposon gag domain-containing protein n=1 Tax=Solanum verrucosum TaxID=315347 RepID=A0AAF0ZNN3_SOLVR|nr:hypothetical protein MTR67_039512 [Solanum verrucosum]
MNPRKFLGSQIGEEPQNIIDKVKKIFGVMQVTCNDRVELASYQLKDVAHIWLTKSKENRGADPAFVTWEYFTGSFLDRYFLRGLREAKAKEFKNLSQGTMSVQEYGLKFTGSERQGQGGNNNRTQYTTPAAPTCHPTRHGALFGTGGDQRQNKLYALQNCQDQEDSHDVVIVRALRHLLWPPLPASGRVCHGFLSYSRECNLIYAGIRATSSRETVATCAKRISYCRGTRYTGLQLNADMLAALGAQSPQEAMQPFNRSFSSKNNQGGEDNQGDDESSEDLT